MMTEALSKLNFRDVGCLPADGGRQVRRGLIFRSEGPASFDIDHHRELEALNISLVCDLRSETERDAAPNNWCRSEEHTSELQSLMRNSYAVFCLKTKKHHKQTRKVRKHQRPRYTVLTE